MFRYLRSELRRLRESYFHDKKLKRVVQDFAIFRLTKRMDIVGTIAWEPRSPGIQNEPLYTRVYATGALELFNLNLEMHKRRRAKKNELPMSKLKQHEIIEKEN